MTLILDSCNDLEFISTLVTFARIYAYIRGYIEIRFISKNKEKNEVSANSSEIPFCLAHKHCTQHANHYCTLSFRCNKLED
jgi:hypothetical protein